MFILDVQESYLVTHASVSFILDSFSYRFLQNVEQSSLCYSQGSCWLRILYICVYLFIGMGALRGEVSCAVVKLGLRPLAESDLATLLSALM